MATSQHEHTRARREVLQVMYQSELTGTSYGELIDDTGATAMLLIPERPEGVEDNDLIGEDLAEYAGRLLRGIVSHLDEIDGWIADTAENWTLDRMPLVDRNIIRLARLLRGHSDERRHKRSRRARQGLRWRRVAQVRERRARSHRRAFRRAGRVLRTGGSVGWRSFGGT